MRPERWRQRMLREGAAGDPLEAVGRARVLRTALDCPVLHAVLSLAEQQGWTWEQALNMAVGQLCKGRRDLIDQLEKAALEGWTPHAAGSSNR